MDLLFIEDMRVLLYRKGAKEDFSNLRVGFTTNGHIVHITFSVRQPDGTDIGPGSAFAQL